MIGNVTTLYRAKLQDIKRYLRNGPIVGKVSAHESFRNFRGTVNE